jgi:Holliday junction resolvase RusA-like endonuclease
LDWQQTVSWAAKQQMAGRPPVVYPVKVTIWFYRKRQGKCDLDNLSKAVLDALNGIVFEDDSQVVELHLFKYFCNMGQHVPGIVVIVEEP